MDKYFWPFFKMMHKRLKSKVKSSERILKTKRYGLKISKYTRHSLFFPEVAIVNVHGDLTACLSFNKIFCADSKKSCLQENIHPGKEAG